MAYPVTDLVGYFGGRWSLRRWIHDPGGSLLGEFEGAAEFRVGGDDLLYEERGVLRLGAYQGEAFRSLRYHVTGRGQASVYFDYGDFFHEVDLREGFWRVRHPCRADLYDGEYDIVGPRRWRLLWSVAGPTKNHTLTSEFSRED